MKFARFAVVLTIVHLVCGAAMAAEAKPQAVKAKQRRTPWGSIRPSEDDPEVMLAQVVRWPQDGRLALRAPQANITRAFFLHDRSRGPLTLQFNTDATAITLLVPKQQPEGGNVITLETAEKSGQRPSGRIVFSALDAKVHGTRAKLETHPGNHRIGYWTHADDYVTWPYSATRPGMYEVELTYSVSGGAGNEIAIDMAGKTLSAKLNDTGSYYRYTSLVLGKLYLPKPGKYTLAVRCTKKVGGAVMNLKAVTLRPTSEGKSPSVQAADGTLTCNSRDAVAHGVKLQYEHNPKKLTLGYWVNVKDWASWDIEIKQAGRFEVEILQGCGKGQGGSEVQLSVAGTSLSFKVQDTGHFQNFVARRIGTIEIAKPGQYQIEVRPKRKARAAVMDLQRVRLLPVAVKQK